MKQIALIGPTASGKSNLAIEMALKYNAYILSIDSLSIYKEIDIASAKPSAQELQQVKHFGIDEIYLDTPFSVAFFIKRYKEVVDEAKLHGKNLIIVGGTSFYLKGLTTGLSQLPEYSEQTRSSASEMLQDLPSAYDYLQRLDPIYMQNIEPTDQYRIEKMLFLTLESQISPTAWFEQHPPKATIETLDIFNIEVERTLLRTRIEKRTQEMLKNGLIDEVAMLEQKYGRQHNAMKAIGVIEVLEYLDGVDQQMMIENIITHTAQLAKRQQTFNRTQFPQACSAPLNTLPEKISKVF